MNKSNKTALLIVCILFGYLGIHRFCVGKYKSGLLYLCTCGLFGFGWIADIILIATDKFGGTKFSDIQPTGTQNINNISSTHCSSPLVYVNQTGSKYHKNKKCCNYVLNSMSESQAIAIGLTPCKKCYHKR